MCLASVREDPYESRYTPNRGLASTGRSVRILILTQHFVPEVTAGRFRLEAFARALVERGHDVHVICPVPNHPRGVVEQGFRNRLVLRRRVGGSHVTYLRVVMARDKTFWSRIGYYASYAALASVAGGLMRRPQVILASSPPLPVAAAGALLAARHRAPLLLDIRDLWPESAVALGELRQGALLTAAERLERLVYAKADRVVTTNDAFRRWIEERAPAGARIDVVSNGTSMDWLRVGESAVSRSSVGLPDGRFVWAYAGNIGLAHGLEFTVDAARLLGEEYVLLVIGEGPRRFALEARAAAAPPGTVDLRGLMSPAKAALHLRAADAVLVSERQEMTVSAKLYDACAVGRPIVAACSGELRRLVEREEIALAVPHGDAEALARALHRLRSNPELRARLSHRAREFAGLHLRERQAEALSELLESSAAQR
jgi:glycosyltransferase involved in cell wall biosynthesis